MDKNERKVSPPQQSQREANSTDPPRPGDEDEPDHSRPSARSEEYNEFKRPVDSKRNQGQDRRGDPDPETSTKRGRYWNNRTSSLRFTPTYEDLPNYDDHKTDKRPVDSKRNQGQDRRGYPDPETSTKPERYSYHRPSAAFTPSYEDLPNYDYSKTSSSQPQQRGTIHGEQAPEALNSPDGEAGERETSEVLTKRERYWRNRELSMSFTDTYEDLPTYDENPGRLRDQPQDIQSEYQDLMDQMYDEQLDDYELAQIQALAAGTTDNDVLKANLNKETTTADFDSDLTPRNNVNQQQTDSVFSDSTQTQNTDGTRVTPEVLTKRERYWRNRQRSQSFTHTYDDLPASDDKPETLMDQPPEIQSGYQNLFDEADDQQLAQLEALAMSIADGDELKENQNQKTKQAEFNLQDSDFPPLPASEPAPSSHLPNQPSVQYRDGQQQIDLERMRQRQMRFGQPNPVVPQQSTIRPPIHLGPTANRQPQPYRTMPHGDDRTIRRAFPPYFDSTALRSRMRMKEEKEKPPKSFSIKNFKQFLKGPGLSLFPTKDFIAQTLVTDKLVKLNFSGLDQLTDTFLRVLYDQNVRLPHLTKFSASGCVLLTDSTPLWLSYIAPQVEEIVLVGCRKVTSAGLSTMFEAFKSLTLADLCCTGVTVLPLAYRSSKVTLRLDGCTMICPPKEKLNKVYLSDPKSYVVDGSSITLENHYKLVILKSGKVDLDFAKYLAGGGSDTSPENRPMTITTDVQYGDKRLNIFEINRVQSGQDMILSDGSVCLFPVLLEKLTPDRLDYLRAFYFRKIAFVPSKAEYTVPVLVGLHDSSLSDEEAQQRLTSLLEGVQKILADTTATLEEKLHIFIKRKWLVNDYDIKGQLHAGDAAKMLDKMRATKVLVDVINTDKKDVPPTFLREAFDHIKSRCPWLAVNCAETKSIMEDISQQKHPIQAFSETEESVGPTAEKSGFKISKMAQPYLKTMAGTMHQLGSGLFFPDVEGCPFITDFSWYTKVLGVVMNPPPQDDRLKRQIRFFSHDQPVWIPLRLKDALSSCVTEKQYDLLIRLLLHYGVLIEAVVDRFSESDVPYIYVVHDTLPNQSHIVLAGLWPDFQYQNGTVIQRNKHYQFACGAPLSLYSSFISQCAKIYKFTLLWKYGFLLRHGVVDILVDLEANERGEPVICVSARTEYQRSETTAVRVNCLWSVMNKITAILDYKMKGYSCFATVVIPCPTCIPTMNNSKTVKDKDVWLYYEISLRAGASKGLKCLSKKYLCSESPIVVPCPTCVPNMTNSKIVKDTDVWLYYELLLRAGASRGLKCRSKKYQCSETPLNNTRTTEQLIGPELSLVPKHVTSQLAECKDALSDYNRCAVCQNCAVLGRKCPKNGLQGKTILHCPCEQTPSLPLCLSCGMCANCEALFRDMNNFLNPQSVRGAAWKAYSIKDMEGVEEGKEVKHPKFSWFHTQKDTLYVISNVNFSPEFFDRIEIGFFRGKKPFLGLVGEDHEPMFTFDPGEGCLGRNWTFKEEIAKRKEWETKDCTRLSMRIRYVTEAERSDLSEGKDDVIYAVEVYKTGDKVWTEFLPGKVVKFAMRGTGAGSMILETPSLSTVAPMTRSHPNAEAGMLFAEVERPDQPNTFLLCPITPDRDGTYTVPLETNMVQMKREDPRIHPLGYSFATGADRTLYMSKRHFEEWKIVPDTRLEKRRKKQQTAKREHRLTVSSIEDLNEMIEKKFIIPAPLWFFTEEQRKGWEPGIIDSCACQRYYVSTEAQICAYTRSRNKYEEWVRDAVEEQLAGEFMAPVLLLPAALTGDSLMYPFNPPMSKPEMFQVVQLCANSAKRLDLHILNLKGRKLMESHTYLTNFFLPFHMFMSIGCQVVLPGYSKLLPDVSTEELNEEQVQYYLRELLLSITYTLIIFNTGKQIAKPSALPEDILAFIDYVIEESLQNKATSVEVTPASAICPAHLEQDKLDPDDFDSIPEIRNYLQFLKTAKLELTVETLPEMFFKDLRALEEFNAENCGITKFPTGLGACANLTSLKLAGSNITELPADMMGMRNRLKELDISNLKLSSIPKVVVTLSKLETLTADCLLLEELPEDLGDLSNLTKLSLNGSRLTKLPASFTKLKKLTCLNLRGVPWPEVKPGHYLTTESFNEFLSKWNLKRFFANYEDENGRIHSILKPFDEDVNLTLDPKEMGKLNAAIFNLFPRFGYSGNNTPGKESVGGFPPEILELENLVQLDLSYQGIVSVPVEIGHLSKLESLVLNENPYLTTLPGTLGCLPLETLDISDCPSLRTPPKEITSKGFSPVMAYLRRLTTGSVSCKRTKLMLVGLGGAGKTSLVKALLSGKNKYHVQSGQDITDGIDIHTWTVTRNEDSVTYSVWDFAGQTVYYNTHQFFLSDRAVYLLLWNLRLGAEHAGLDFWLSSISVHAPHAPVLIVGTHLDQVTNFNIPVQELQKRYPQIAGFYSVSSLTGQGVSDLQEKLLDATLREKYMGEQIPEVWLNFEKFILKERETLNVISYERAEQLAYESGVFDEVETTQAVRFLHDLGAVQHFDNQFLKDQVVINPQWIVDVMACVVSVKDTPIRNGKFKHSDIGKVWQKYPKKLHNWLLRLTEKFDLTFPLPEKSLNLVPCLLPETEPENIWPEPQATRGHYETLMVYKFAYLPVGLFNRGQVRLYEYCDSSVIWKNGSLLKKSGHLALLSQKRDNKLIVKCQGPRPENLLFLIHEVFETLIQESFKGVAYDFKVPCPMCLKSARDPYMFKGSTIRRASGLKTPFLQCVKHFHIPSTADLNGICPPSDSQDYDLHLKNSVQSLSDLRHDLCADVFISFCKEDLPQPGQDMVDPRKIKESIETAGYRCWLEEGAAKDDLENRILALRDAKIFLALVSNKYVKDEDCCNLFKFARTVLRKKLVLATVGPSTDHVWKQSTLGMLVADEVYCNMQRVEQYGTKIDELLKIICDRVSQGSGEKDMPPCFFSYCWKNSKRAVDLGQKSTSEATACGDPRDMKDYLEAHGIHSWLDIERTGVHDGGLFEDIAEGLRHARLMIACVSDEYVDSLNCQMEFRFAAKTLDLPVVIAVVGTSQQWRATGIGMDSLKYPQVNFQESTETAMGKLLELSRKHIDTNTIPLALKKKKDDRNKEQKKASYQELYELAQRKMLRQIISYSDIYEHHPLPRIIVVDFAEPEDSISHGRRQETPGERPQLVKRSSSTGLRTDHSFLLRDFCFKFICEHEQGWHIVGTPIHTPSDFDEADLVRYSPYLARALAVIKHSSKIQLNCVGGEEGDRFTKWLEENCRNQSSNYKTAYQELRRRISKQRKGKTFDKLARCLTTSGKMFWLCEAHQKSPHITVMSSSSVPVGSKTMESAVDSYMMDHLKPLELWEKQAQVFKSQDNAKHENENRKITPVDSKQQPQPVAPTPKPRTSISKPESGDQGPSDSVADRKPFKARTKFKAAGYVAQASVKAMNYQKGSKACVIL